KTVQAMIAFGVGLSLRMLGLIVVNSQLKLSARTADVVTVVTLRVLVVLSYLFCLLLVVLAYGPLAVAMSIVLCALMALALASISSADRVRKGLQPRRNPSPVFSVVGRVGTQEALASARREKHSAQKRWNKYSRAIAAYEAEHSATGAEQGSTAGSDASMRDPRKCPRSASRLRRALDELIR